MRTQTFVLLAGSMLFSACASSPSSSGTKVSTRAGGTNVSTNTVALTKGMPVKEVVELLGEPAEKKPMKTASGTGEIWIYRRSFEERYGSAPDGVMTVAEYGPVTPAGVRSVTYVQKAMFTDQFRMIEETTLILMIGEQVVELDRTRKAGTPFTR